MRNQLKNVIFSTAPMRNLAEDNAKCPACSRVPGSVKSWWDNQETWEQTLPPAAAGRAHRWEKLSDDCISHVKSNWLSSQSKGEKWENVCYPVLLSHWQQTMLHIHLPHAPVCLNFTLGSCSTARTRSRSDSLLGTLLLISFLLQRGEPGMTALHFRDLVIERCAICQSSLHHIVYNLGKTL